MNVEIMNNLLIEIELLNKDFANTNFSFGISLDPKTQVVITETEKGISYKVDISSEYSLKENILNTIEDDLAKVSSILNPIKNLIKKR